MRFSISGVSDVQNQVLAVDQLIPQIRNPIAEETEEIEDGEKREMRDVREKRQTEGREKRKREREVSSLTTPCSHVSFADEDVEEGEQQHGKVTHHL